MSFSWRDAPDAVGNVEQPSQRSAALESSSSTAMLRVLSYNMNLLPRGASEAAFQDERIRAFVTKVRSEQYDVVVLQEVFAAAMLPNVAQRALCFQRRVVDALEACGFVHCVLPRQPSYYSMLRYGITTDTGLLILSRLPVSCRGSFTFRSTTHGEQRSLKGCLFAKVAVRSQREDAAVAEALIFNVYMRGSPSKLRLLRNASSGNPTEAEPSGGHDAAADQQRDQQQIDQLCRFIEITLEQHGGKCCPFFLMGTLIFDGMTPGSLQHCKPFQELVQRLQRSPSVESFCDVVAEDYGRHLPTRPPRPFFLSRGELMCVDDMSEPPCHDFIFIGNSGSPISANAAVPFRVLRHRAWRLEKFHAPPLRPYLYLSDHFGLSVDAEVFPPVPTKPPPTGLRSRIDEQVATESGANKNVPDNESQHGAESTADDRCLHPRRRRLPSLFRHASPSSWSNTTASSSSSTPLAATACRHTVAHRPSEDSWSTASFIFSEWLTQQAPDRSPYGLWATEFLLLAAIAYACLTWLPMAEYWLPLLALVASWRWLLGNTVLSEGLAAAATSAAFVASRAAVLVDDGRHATTTALEADSAATPNPLPAQVASPALPSSASIFALWERAVETQRWQRCVGQRALDGNLFEPEWLTFAQVDTKVRDFGSGLLFESSLARGDTVGLMSGSSRRALIADLATLAFGLQSLSLAGTHSTLRQVLDGRNIRVVICGRACVATVLECRSRALRTIVALQHTEYEEEALAKDLGVELISFDAVERRGKNHPVTPCPQTGPLAPYTLTVESSTADLNSIEVVQFTQHDALRAIDALRRHSVVGGNCEMSSSSSSKSRNSDLEHQQAHDVVVWHAAFSSIFYRVVSLAVLCSGGSVACAESMRLQDALKYFQPTILFASPSLFFASEQQFRDNQRKWSRLYRQFFLAVFRFRSQLIHEHRRDSSTLRRLMFRSFQNQIGRRVHKIVLHTSEASIPFYLHEFIAVCYTTNIREVFFQPQVGVILVDGCVASHATVNLEASLSTAEQNIATMRVTMNSLFDPGAKGPWHAFDIAAAWVPSDGAGHSRLSVLGPRDALLWPVDYLHANAQDLEREYSQCRYVFDLFVTGAPKMPLVAVVHPNKDLLDWEWQTRFPAMTAHKLTWSELVAFATPLILTEFQSIAQDRNFHPSHRISAIHLHPHAFSEHNDFLTPHGRLKRSRLADYFSRHVQRLYRTREPVDVTLMSPNTPNAARAGEFQKLLPVSSSSRQDSSLAAPPSSRGALPSHSDAATEAEQKHHGDVPFPLLTSLVATAAERVSSLGSRSPAAVTAPRRADWKLRVPVAVDIGGTFAKVVYLRPPGATTLPNFVSRDHNSLGALITPDFRFFRDEQGGDALPHSQEELQQQGYGEVCFAKLSSKHVPSFVQFLQENNTTSLYKKEHVEQVRATGGGAFKYAPLVNAQLGIKLRVVKEMDSIVWGLNLMLRVAPETIFTVDPETGAPRLGQISQNDSLGLYPFLIVNIGSGISIVKCVSDDGTYERVGGSAIGGATFWGLVRTMTNIQSWDEVLEITRVDGPGDNTNVDLLVGDIYGFSATDLPNMLSVDTVASTFGKLGTDRFSRSVHQRRPSLALSDEDGMIPYEALSAEHLGGSDGLFDVEGTASADPATAATPAAGMILLRRSHSSHGGNASTQPQSSGTPVTAPLFHPRANVAGIDIVRSLLIMIANNVTQLAYLHCRTEGATRVFFTGGFVRENPLVWKQIARSMRYWSKDTLPAHFISHDGYLGALGTATMDLNG